MAAPGLARLVMVGRGWAHAHTLAHRLLIITGLVEVVQLRAPLHTLLILQQQGGLIALETLAAETLPAAAMARGVADENLLDAEVEGVGALG